MVDQQGGQSSIPVADLDELLVKGEDGKFYILRGETLTPVAADATAGEQGLAEFTTRAATVPPPPSPQQFITDVLKEASIGIADSTIASRVEKALALFFKDLRNRLETKDVLTRPPKVGGAGLSLEQADHLLRIAETKRTAWMQAFAPTVETERQAAPVLPTPPRPPTPVVSVPPPPPPSPPVVQGAALREGPRPTKPVTSTVKPPPVNLPIVEEVVKQAIVEKKIEKQIVVPVPTPPPPPPVVQVTPPKPVSPSSVVRDVSPKPVGRPLIMDVTPPPRDAVGPIDELRYDLVAFRRLGRPEEATAKVFEKIKRLFQSSWKEGMGGVEAWKSSPVMRLVREASKQSFVGDVPVAAAIQSALRDGKSMVSVDEWNACAAFLQRLDAFIQGGK